MSEATYITAPREGVNDDVVRVVEWRVEDGRQVVADETVLVVETTKATIDVAAPRSGYLFRLAATGAEVPVGAALAVVTSSPERPSAKIFSPPSAPAAGAASQVVTVKARPLMEQHGLKPADFPNLSVIRTSDVEEMLATRALSASAPASATSRLFRGQQLDADANWDEVLERVDARELDDLLAALRRRMKARFNRHVPTGSLLHDRWQLARDHGFGEGTSVYDECLILGDVRVGKHCWVGPYTILDGQGGLRIGDYVDIGAGAHVYSHNTIERALTGHRAALLTKATNIGNCCFIAPHAMIGPGTVLGDRCFVAAGSYVEGVFAAGSYIAGNPGRVAGQVVIAGERAHVQLAKKSSQKSAD